MRAFKSVVGAAVLAIVLSAGLAIAQYPTGIPSSVQNALYGYLWGGTFTPNATGGAVLAVATTIRPALGGGQSHDGVYVAPTFALSGTNSAISITTLGGLHVGWPAIVNGSAMSLSNVAGLVLDAESTTAGSNNFSLWNKGDERRDQDMYVGFGTGAASVSLAMASTTNITIPASSAFGTNATVVGNQYAFAINVGTGGTAVSGVVIFGTPFTKIPVCIPSTMQAVTINNMGAARVTSAAVDSIKISADTAWPASTTINVLCFGKSA